MDDWTKNPTNNRRFKNYLFGATSIVKNSDKENYVCCGYGITFNSRDCWSFDNDNARNVIIFGVDNSSSSHGDNRKNNFLMLGLGPTFRVNGSFGSPEKKIILILLEQLQNFARVYITMLIIVICLLMERKYSNLKLTTKMLTFQLDVFRKYI